MISALLKPIIMRFLSDFVEDVGGQTDFNVSLLSGTVAFERVSLKAQAVTEVSKLGQFLPVELTSITVASIRLDVPLTRLNSRAAHLEVNDLVCNVDWLSESMFNEEEMAKAFRQAAIDNADHAWETAQGRPPPPVAALANLYLSPTSILNRSLIRILDNARVTGQNVTLRIDFPPVSHDAGLAWFDSLRSERSEPSAHPSPAEMSSPDRSGGSGGPLGGGGTPLEDFISVEAASSSVVAEGSMQEPGAPFAVVRLDTLEFFSCNDEGLETFNADATYKLRKRLVVKGLSLTMSLDEVETVLEPMDVDSIIDLNTARHAAQRFDIAFDMESAAVNLSPAVVSAILRLVADLAEYQTWLQRVEKRRLQHAAKSRASTALDDYLALVRQRMAGGPPNPARDAARQALETQFTPEEIWMVFQQALAPANRPALTSVFALASPDEAEHDVRSAMMAEGLPLMDVHPRFEEIDVVFPPGPLGIELEEVGTDVVVSAVSEDAAVGPDVQPGMVLLGCHGFSFSTLTFDGKMYMLEVALRPCLVRFRRRDEKMALSLYIASLAVHASGLQSARAGMLRLHTTSAEGKTRSGVSWTRVDLASGGLCAGSLDEFDLGLVSGAQGPESVSVTSSGGDVELRLTDVRRVDDWVRQIELPPVPLHAPASSSMPAAGENETLAMVLNLKSFSAAMRVGESVVGARVDALALATTDGGTELAGSVRRVTVFADAVAEVAVAVLAIKVGVPLESIDVELGKIDFELQKPAYDALLALVDDVAHAVQSLARPTSSPSITPTPIAPRRSAVKMVVSRALSTVLGYEPLSEDRISLSMDNALEFHHLLERKLGRPIASRLPLDLVLVQETAGQVWDAVTMAACNTAQAAKRSAANADAEDDAVGLQLSVCVQGLDVLLFDLVLVRVGAVRVGQNVVNKTSLLAVAVASLDVQQVSNSFKLVKSTGFAGSTSGSLSSLPGTGGGTGGGAAAGGDAVDLLRLSLATGPRKTLATAKGALALNAPCRALDLDCAARERALVREIETTLFKETVATLDDADDERLADAEKLLEVANYRACAALRAYKHREDQKPPNDDTELLVAVAGLSFSLLYDTMELIAQLLTAFTPPPKARAVAAEPPATAPYFVGGLLIAMQVSELKLVLEDATYGTFARTPFALVTQIPKLAMQATVHEAVERVSVSWSDLSVGKPEQSNSKRMPTVILPWSASASLQLSLARQRQSELVRLVVADLQAVRLTVLLKDARALLDVVTALPSRFEPLMSPPSSAAAATATVPPTHAIAAESVDAEPSSPMALRAISAALGVTVSDSASRVHEVTALLETVVSASVGLVEAVVQETHKFQVGGRKVTDAYLPVLFANITAVQAHVWMSDATKDAALTVFGIPSASFYNTRLALWEPLVEPFDVEVRASQIDDALLGKARSLRANVTSRINVNLTEDGVKLVFSLLEEFEKAASKPATKLQKSARRQRGEPNGQDDQYILVNQTGDAFTVSKLEQVGCTAKGRLTIRVRDGWSLPHRSRWRNEPHVKCELFPACPAPVEAGDVQRPWGHEALVLQLDYPGALPSQQLPELEVEITNNALPRALACRIKLAPYMVSHGKPVDEWHRLSPKDQSDTYDGEIFLQIVFESYDALTSVRWAFHGVKCDNMDLAALNFVNVPNKWDEEINYADIMSKLEHLGTTSLRRAELQLAGDTGRLKLPMDDVGRYAISVKVASTQMDIIVKAAMRSDYRRIIKLKSPVVVKNHTGDSLELLLCDSTAVDMMGEHHVTYPQLRRIMEDDDVVVDYSGNHLHADGMGVDMVLDGLMGSTWVDGGYTTQMVEALDDHARVSFLQYEFSRPRCIEFFRVGLPKDWSVAEPPTRVVVSARKDLASIFVQLLELNVQVNEGAPFVEAQVPEPDFFKLYRFEFFGTAGEPAFDQQRGPGGTFAIAINYLYMFENPGKQAALGEWCACFALRVCAEGGGD